jgi:hypothetical protein
MQREKANERKKLCELQAKLDSMKIKDIALKANKSSKALQANPRSTSKLQQASQRQSSKSKSK